MLAPGGLLIFATFGPDTLKELRTAFAAIDDAPHVNRFIDLHDIGDMLVNAGFTSPVMEMEMLTLTYADLKTLMRDLKGIGAHNAAACTSAWPARKIGVGAAGTGLRNTATGGTFACDFRSDLWPCLGG